MGRCNSYEYGDKMKNKLITFNLITISLVIFIITATGNYFYQKAITKSKLLYTTELQKQLSNSFLMKIKSVENTLEVMAKTDAVIGYLQNTLRDETADKVKKEQEVRELFHTYGNIHPEYLSMVLISDDGNDYISNDSYRVENDSFESEPWFEEAMEEGYSYQFYNAIRNLKSWKIYDNHTFLSVAKAVEIGEKKAGVLLVDISLQDLRDFYRELEFDTNNFFFLMNDAGQIILSPTNEIVHRVKSEWFKEDEGIVKAELVRRHFHLIYNKYAGKRIIVVSAYDVQKEQDVLKTFFQISLSVAMLAFVLAISWSIYFVSKVTQPLVKLASLMKKASTGNLELRFEEECDTEIEALGDAFNKMLVKIKELLGMVHEEKIQKQDAEMRAMQEKLKPDFLYVTLGLLKKVTKENDIEKAKKVATLASDFYNIRLDRDLQLITLDEELKMVTSYIEIQRLRDEHLFKYEISCSAEQRSFMVPHMCLQPLVENSINHGIKHSGTEGTFLKIKVLDEENGITILIEDNGSCMPTSIMRQLNHNLAHNDWTEWEGGYGVQEVGRKIWDGFAKGSGLSYYINRKGFTVAKLTMIYEAETEGEGEHAN